MNAQDAEKLIIRDMIMILKLEHKKSGLDK